MPRGKLKRHPTSWSREFTKLRNLGFCFVFLHKTTRFCYDWWVSLQWPHTKAILMIYVRLAFPLCVFFSFKDVSLGSRNPA